MVVIVNHIKSLKMVYVSHAQLLIVYYVRLIAQLNAMYVKMVLFLIHLLKNHVSQKQLIHLFHVHNYLVYVYHIK